MLAVGSESDHRSKVERGRTYEYSDFGSPGHETMSAWFQTALKVGIAGALTILISIPPLGSWFYFRKTGKFLLPFTGPHGGLAWHEYWSMLVPITFAVWIVFCVLFYGLREIWLRFYKRPT